jgi:hypothetical protein
MKATRRGRLLSGENQMAIATWAEFKDGFLVVTDDAGKQHRYQKGEEVNLPGGALIQVEHGTARLIMQGDGKAALRRNGEGLPPEFPVIFAQAEPQVVAPTHLPTWAAGGGTYVFCEVS